VIGFAVDNPYEFEIPEPEHPLMPRFRFYAPTVALRNATAEEVVLAACTVLDGRSTPDAVFFDLAVEAGSEGDDEQAEYFWRHCLATGEPKGHFGLGYTLYDLGRPREAYGHLFEYTKVVPRNPWAWCWLGKVSEEIGEREQALRCYRRAVRLERESDLETDAQERLEELERPRRRRSRRRH
jgi:tetratricopeptide (TPR) repeat protein